MDSHTNRPVVMLGVLWTQAGVSTMLVAARLYVRLLIEPRAGWDDWTMVIALVSDQFCEIELSLRRDFRYLTTREQGS